MGNTVIRLLLFLALLSPCWAATVTVEWCTMSNRSVVMEYDYDDVTLQVTAIRVRNATPFSARMQIRETVSGSTLDVIGDPNSIRAVNSSAMTRLKLQKISGKVNLGTMQLQGTWPW